MVRACLMILYAISGVWSQAGEEVAFDNGSWIIEDPEARLMTYLGQKSLYLCNGVAYLKDLIFENGTIEIDIAPHGHHSNAGIVFRLESESSHEVVFLRPHRSGLPHALQYAPVFNGSVDWQLYNGKGFSQAVSIPVNRWVHVRVVVSGGMAKVYLDRNEKPCLMIEDLKHGISRGSIGLWSVNGGANFANFTYQPDLETRSLPLTPVKRAEKVIKYWELSQSFPTMGDQQSLPTILDHKAIQWLAVESEPSGLVNISRFRSKATRMQPNHPSEMRDTVYARSTIIAEKAMTKKMSFGYSDEISVYLNKNVLYSGNNRYQSRGPSFLGLAGLGNDAVYLHLKKGRNEVVLAVTETSGGWGFICEWEDLMGIRIDSPDSEPAATKFVPNR